MPRRLGAGLPERLKRRVGWYESVAVSAAVAERLGGWMELDQRRRSRCPPGVIVIDVTSEGAQRQSGLQL